MDLLNRTVILTGLIVFMTVIISPQITYADLYTDPTIEHLPNINIPVILVDESQNFTDEKEILSVSNSQHTTPFIMTGKPFTLFDNMQVTLYENSQDPGVVINSNVDQSHRMVFDTSDIKVYWFKTIIIDTDITADSFTSRFLTDNGTNWVNLDISALKEYSITSFDNTSVSVIVNDIKTAIVSPGQIIDGQALVEISPDMTISGTDNVKIEIDVGGGQKGVILNEKPIPIVFDVFSFGFDGTNNNIITNAIYRLELEEDEPSNFYGTVKYILADYQALNSRLKIQLDTIGQDITVIIPSSSDVFPINYNGKTTNIEIQDNTLDIYHTGVVSVYSTLQQHKPVYITINDMDLNIHPDKVDVYNVVNDITTDRLDAVGMSDEVLLEVMFNGERYQRCETREGIEHGGLASTGFNLSETGKNTGIFHGVFDMPTYVCGDGEYLVNTVNSIGGLDFEIKYYDSLNKYKESGVVTSSLYNNIIPEYYIFEYNQTRLLESYMVEINTNEVDLQDIKARNHVIVSGMFDMQHTKSLIFDVIGPNNFKTTDIIYTNNDGSFEYSFVIDNNYEPGLYKILMYIDNHENMVKEFSVVVYSDIIPQWVRNTAFLWHEHDNYYEFETGLQHLRLMTLTNVETVPEWFVMVAGLWGTNQISDDVFLNTLKHLENVDY